MRWPNYGWGIAVLRIVIGVVFLMHGVQKFTSGFSGVAQGFSGAGIPAPFAMAVFITLLEFFGGLALIAGVFTHSVGLLFAGEMAVAVVKVHLPKGFFAPAGFEYPLTLLAGCVVLALSGPGRLYLKRFAKY